MLDHRTTVISCSDWREIVRAYNSVISQLAPDVRQKLRSVMLNYITAYGLEGVYERLNGRTVAQVLSDYQEPAKPPVVCSGERDGLRYTLHEARPAEGEGAGPGTVRDGPGK